MDDGTEALVAVKASSEELRLFSVSRRGPTFDWSEYTRDPTNGWAVSSAGTLPADGNVGAVGIVTKVLKGHSGMVSCVLVDPMRHTPSATFLTGCRQAPGTGTSRPSCQKASTSLRTPGR